MRQVVVESAVGEIRDYAQIGYLDVPNLAVELPESRADSFYNWMDDFVIKGDNGANAEKTGTLRYLAPGHQHAYFVVTLHNLGIFRVAPVKIESGKQAGRRVRAEMYCEAVSLTFDASAVGSGVDTSQAAPPAPPSPASALADKQAIARRSLAPLSLPADLVRPSGLKFRS